MHKQKFKDPLSSTCQISSDKSVFDLESEAWIQSSLGVTFCHWIFFLFSRSKGSNANIGIIANVVCLPNRCLADVISYFDHMTQSM